MVVVAPEDVVVGFKFAGVSETYTEAEKVKSLLDDPEIAVLLIAKDIFDSLNEEIKKKALFSVKPAVVILDESEDIAKVLVKSALGAEFD